MKAVRADFNRRWRPPKGAWWAMCALGAATLVAGGAVWLEWRHLDAQRAALLDDLTRRQAAAASAQPSSTSVPYQASAREMLAERDSTWLGMLATIESNAFLGVTPVSLEFISGDKMFRLDVTATDYPKLLEYVDALNAGEPEARFSITQSQVAASGAVAAVLSAAWSRKQQ